jgi:hypothetical protein
MKSQIPNHKIQRRKSQISRLRSLTAIAFGDGSKASAGEANLKFQKKKSQISRLRSLTAIAFGDGSKASAGEANPKFQKIKPKFQIQNEITRTKSQIPNHKYQRRKSQISRLRSLTAIAFGDGSKASAGEANLKFQKNKSFMYLFGIWSLGFGIFILELYSATST